MGRPIIIGDRVIVRTSGRPAIIAGYQIGRGCLVRYIDAFLPSEWMPRASLTLDPQYGRENAARLVNHRSAKQQIDKRGHKRGSMKTFGASLREGTFYQQNAGHFDMTEGHND